MANNQLLASDNFASGSLAAGWALADGLSAESAIVNVPPHVAQPHATSSTDGQVWTGLTWPSDQISEVTVKTLTSEATTFLNIAIRWQQTAVSGYEAQITNGTAAIYRVDSGSVTRITAIISGLTFATGDIWTVSAAGSCISLYQNGNRVAYVGDATYTGGYPGFYGSSTTNAAHVQVASWRGYNAIQQDGIWQKQGIVLAPTSADLAASGIGVFEGCCMLDTNPQILPGPNVYKLWFSSGSPSAAGIYYAESADLKTWTRHSGAIIADGATPTVIKQGSTYFIYYQLGSVQGTGTTHISTSTDGLTWSASGHTFATGAYPLKPIAVVGGTWYALWGSLNVGTGDFASVNLATAPDGLTWTNYGSNPIISAQSTYPFACAAQVGSTFYVWMQAGPVAPQNTATAKAFDPNECVRYSTTDFHAWSGPVRSLHHSQFFEALNVPVNNTDPVGGNAPVAVFDISGKANMLYLLSQGDNLSPQVAQFSLAIAPAPIASIVTQNEDGLQQVATDAFTNGAGDLSANWTLPTGGTKLKIIAGPLVEPTATSTLCQAVYTGISFSANQYSEVVLHALTGTITQSYIFPTVRASLVAVTDYEGGITSPTGTTALAAAIYKRVAGVATQIGPSMGCTPTVGDTWRLTVIDGSDGFPVLSLFQNGSLILQVQDQSATPLTSGNPGMAAYSIPAIADAQIASWAGGNANVIPSYPSVLFPPFFGR